MTTPPLNNETQEVPIKVFEKFFQVLEKAGVSSELVARFRKTLLEDKTFTETALKEAIFGEESAS
ncbi:MAG: hypothetical protein JW994_07775 [Candidatus Omnitrophica bacterium]|nr:hypothetical protein [Candidatus Omnitrophota bacterium]